MFYESPKFQMEQFNRVFNVCYDLMYNEVVPMDYDRIEYFDALMSGTTRVFMQDFVRFRQDYLTSDRELIAFTMAFDNFANDWEYKN